MAQPTVPGAQTTRGLYSLTFFILVRDRDSGGYSKCGKTNNKMAGTDNEKSSVVIGLQYSLAKV